VRKTVLKVAIFHLGRPTIDAKTDTAIREALRKGDAGIR
jgi:hypothetical protein